MKIIFLDMDGVLCTWRSHVAGKGRGLMEDLDREAVGMLNRLADAGDVLYVLSSTWRRHFTKAQMETRLRAAGWTGRFHDDWATAIAAKLGTTRGHEIQMWLDAHPKVTGFLILDDDSDMLAEQMPHFVKCDAYDGRGFEAFEKANAILHGHKSAWFRHLIAAADPDEARREGARMLSLTEGDDDTEN